MSSDLRTLALAATPGHAPNVPGCTCDRDDDWTDPPVLCPYHEAAFRALSRSTLALMLIDVEAQIHADAAYIAAASPAVVLALLDVVDAARAMLDWQDPDFAHALRAALARVEEVTG